MNRAPNHNLIREFAALGVAQGDIVMLHSSFKALGPVPGGPKAVVEALTAAVGPDGGVLVFVSWDRSPYEANASGGGLSTADREVWPAFDQNHSGIRRNYAGAIGEALLNHREAYRSANPDRSLAALGSGAVALITDHQLAHGFGPGSPLERFVQAGGKTLMLGAPASSLTLVHYAEYLADVPDKQCIAYDVPVLENGEKVWRQTTQMNRDGFTVAAQRAGQDWVAATATAYFSTGRHSAGCVGRAAAQLIEAKDFVAFAVHFLERNCGPRSQA